MIKDFFYRLQSMMSYSELSYKVKYGISAVRINIQYASLDQHNARD